MSRQTKDVIGEKLAKLAQNLADTALQTGTSPETKLEIFKYLTTYYVNTTKVKKNPEESEHEGESFDGWRSKSAETGGTSTDRPT